MSPTRLVRNKFRADVEAAEAAGADVEALRELLGRGRAKKGMFEGNLDEGELEIGQVVSLFKGTQIVTVDEIFADLIEGYRAAASRMSGNSI